MFCVSSQRAAGKAGVCSISGVFFFVCFFVCVVLNGFIPGKFC